MEIYSSQKELSSLLLECLTATANLIVNNNSALKQSSKVIRESLNDIPVLLALSGGSDSTALLLALSKVAPNFGVRPIACHINHGLRADESDKDAEFCTAVCEQLKIECEIIKLARITTKNKSNHINEASLRKLRYDFLTEFAHNRKISFLLTAHTLDDQVETVLFRLFRGTSLSGLRGIEYCRTLTENLKLLRPLIKLDKSQCEKFLASEGFNFRYDSSNSNEMYSRNYIRHKIVPIVIERFPNLSSHLNSLTEIIQAENDYMDDAVLNLLEQFQSIKTNTWSINDLQKQPLALQRRILAYALKNRDIEVSSKRIDKIISLAAAVTVISNSPIYLNLNKFWRLKRNTEKLFWQELKSVTHNFHFEPMLVNIPSINCLSTVNAELLVETFSVNSPLDLPIKDSTETILGEEITFADLSRIKPPLVLRQRQPGDRIQPIGMPISVKLKKYLHTHKKNVKSQILHPALLLADQEEVIWLPGIGISKKIKVNETPSHILRWRQKTLNSP